MTMDQDGYNAHLSAIKKQKAEPPTLSRTPTSSSIDATFHTATTSTSDGPTAHSRIHTSSSTDHTTTGSSRVHTSSSIDLPKVNLLSTSPLRTSMQQLNIATHEEVVENDCEDDDESSCADDAFEDVSETDPPTQPRASTTPLVAPTPPRAPHQKTASATELKVAAPKVTRSGTHSGIQPQRKPSFLANVKVVLHYFSFFNHFRVPSDHDRQTSPSGRVNPYKVQSVMRLELTWLRRR